MPYLKPRHSFLRGVEVQTIAPGMRTLKFLGPCLDSRGDECRAAKKALLQHEKLLTQKKTTTEDQEQEQEQENLDEKTLKLRINYAIASLKQQYNTALNEEDKQNGYTEENKDTSQAWYEAFSHYFTEDDVETILFSMQTGKYMDRAEAFEMAREAHKKGFQAPN